MEGTVVTQFCVPSPYAFGGAYKQRRNP